MADALNHAPARGARCVPALLLEPLCLARRLIGALNVGRQFLVDDCFRKNLAVCDLRVAESRLDEGACVGDAGLCLLPVLCRNGSRTRRTRKDDLLDEPSARIVVDALDGVRHGHTHLVFPCGIGCVEEEFAVLDGDGTHAACDHLPDDIRPMGECGMRDVVTLERGTKAVDSGTHIIARICCAECCAHKSASIPSLYVLHYEYYTATIRSTSSARALHLPYLPIFHIPIRSHAL